MFANGLKNMVSVPAWPLVADGASYLPVALKAEPKSLPNKNTNPCYLNPTGYGLEQRRSRARDERLIAGNVHSETGRMLAKGSRRF